jgi:nucleoside-diphosphate-sugar epimerase
LSITNRFSFYVIAIVLKKLEARSYKIEATHNMILVTGGAGLLGNELINQLLANGKTVKAIYNKTLLKNNAPQLIQIQADILDIVALEEAMQGVTQIYHCAAIVSFNPKDKEQLLKVNVVGTANVVNVAIEAAVQKIVHVSSVAALGRIRNGEEVNESMQWTPQTSNSVYGESKYLGEMEVWRGIAEGLNAAIVNPSIILGEADWNNSSTAIFKNVYDEFGWYTTGCTGWVDVQDVAKAMIAIMDSTIVNEKFIVSAHNETYQNVFNQIADGFGKKRPSKKVTPLIAAIVWRLEKWKSFFTKKKALVTKETAKTALTSVYYNNEKLLQVVPGFQYQPLEKTITRICTYLAQK